MPEVISKLQPDRDLQCYFFRPSAIAAMSQAGPAGFLISGTWRQQFDWAVLEWNRDNVIEHPSLRKLPDGDLSGLHLSYEEVRTNCLTIDSDIYPTVDWPSLRIWADDGSGEKLYMVPLANYKTAVEGSYQCATADITLSGTPTQGDYVGFAFLMEHYPYQFYANDSLENAVQQMAAGVNAFSPTMRATANGTTIHLTYVGAGQTIGNSTTGANGNRVALYTYVSGAMTEHWDVSWRQFAGGTSPTKWRIDLPFNSLYDKNMVHVPTTAVRKMRWTYAADLQAGEFQRSEFEVKISNWAVTGTGGTCEVAGPGSRRIEDTDSTVRYSGTWAKSSGNFSGGTIHFTSTPQAALECVYTNAAAHQLYLGSRLADNGAAISVSIDAGGTRLISLGVSGEDVLTRTLLAEVGPGTHTVRVAHQGDAGTYFYFDYLEAAIPAGTLPTFPREPKITLATDWDTDHSISIPPERTAWLIHSLGFDARVNHYAGALWFYELVRPGHEYARGTVTFTGSPDPNLITTIRIGRTYEPPEKGTVIEHLNLIGDTTATLAKAFELEINRGYTAIRATASGNQITIYAREMGAPGNTITLGISASTANLTIAKSDATLTGGVDGAWRTDLDATPRLNRAARDWHRSYLQALRGYGVDATVAFSMELQHGDPDVAAGIAQRYPDQQPVLLTTPALQTNFSPDSIAFWRQIYADMAGLQTSAGMQPYLQFGEVQWWYFPNGSGMPFYDAYTTSAFRAQYGRDMSVIVSNSTDPASMPEEAQFLPGLIGAFTSEIMQFVTASFPAARFEVLYPEDVNNTPLNRVINYPAGAWTPSELHCLKTESFTYTYGRNLNLARQTIDSGIARGFPPTRRSHLVGIGDVSTCWVKETRMAQGRGFESVVLFALDQFCLIGYAVPLSRGMRRSFRAG